MMDVIGAFAVFLTIIAYSQSKKEKFLFFNFFAVLGLSVVLIHSSCIVGGLTGLWSALLYLVAMFSIENEGLNKRLATTTPIISFALYVAFSEQNMMSLLPAISYIFITYSIFQSNLYKTKVYLLIGCLFWLIYTVWIGNIYPIIADVVGIVILLISLWKSNNISIKSGQGGGVSDVC